MNRFAKPRIRKTTVPGAFSRSLPFLLALALLAGCGSGGSDSEPAAAPAASPPPSGNAPPPPGSGAAANPPPVASFFAPEFVVTGEPFLATAQPDGDTDQLTYDWEVVDTPIGSNPNVTETGVAARIVTDLTGQYTVSLTVTDPDGQSGTASKNVTALPPSVGPVITTVQINSTGDISTTATNVPVTFGQLFVQGDVEPGFAVCAQLENGETVPLQVDAKARYPDGSLKHTVLTSVIPSLQGGQQMALEMRACEEYASLPAISVSELSPEYDATVTIDLDGASYTASLRKSMFVGGPSYWAEGPLLTEAHYQAQFTDENDNAHPLLSARFHLRVYHNGTARTDVIVENMKAFVPGASNLTYTAQIVAGETVVMAPAEIVHNHHSRWRQTIWHGDQPGLHLGYDVGYLVATGAVPNYDMNISFEPAALADLETEWETGTGSRSGLPVKNIMAAGLALEYMPNTGGRPDIGLLPGWISLYLLTMDERAAQATFGTADAAAHWPIHYRDSATGLPLSYEDYPHATTHPNVAAGDSNPLPECVDCDTDLVPDSAHQPSMVFVPYLLTGDYYYLEELHFWTNWNPLRTDPRKRDYGEALLRFQQVRAQAWSMRTLIHTVFVTPDDHPLKSYFQAQLDRNFGFYMSEYVDNPDTNRLGYIRPGWLNPQLETVEVSPWQDDFFTMIMNYARHLGFAQAEPVLDWKIRFALARMNDADFCWQFATVYHLIASEPGPGALYETIGDTYLPTLQDQFPDDWEAISAAECGSADLAAVAEDVSDTGDFVGFPRSATGYPAALRPVIAAALELGMDGAQPAWDKLLAAPHQPKFEENPSFAIRPR